MKIVRVTGIPEELYATLRRQASLNDRPIAAEIVALLKTHVPTARVLRARRAIFRIAERMRSGKPRGRGPFPSTEEMQREDRSR
jgi:hypothetical protein